jgi:hypothetical protein
MWNGEKMEKPKPRFLSENAAFYHWVPDGGKKW